MDIVKNARQKSPLGKIPEIYYLAQSKKIFDTSGTSVRGLFTKYFIKKGTLLGEYRGKICTTDILCIKKRYTQYMFSVDDSDGSTKFIIDGANSKKSSFPKYINAPNKKRDANTEYVQVSDSILLYSIKNIQKDNELLAWYGEDTKHVICQR